MNSSKYSKPRIGLLTLMFKLYDKIPNLNSEMMVFARELTAILENICEIRWTKICKSQEEVNSSLDLFESENLDLAVVVLLTYTPSYVALNPLKKCSLPILIFNTQQLHSVTQRTSPEDLIRNHGMHGVQDLANVLHRAGREFELVTGHYKDEKAIASIAEWCQAARALNFLKHLKVGILGYPFEGMGDFAFDATSLTSEIGVEVKHISEKEIGKTAQEAPMEIIRQQMEKDKDTFNIEKSLTEVEHEQSSRLEWAIRETLIRENMGGFTANFMAVAGNGWLETLPFLASSKMLSEGYGYAGEGDVLTTIAVALMQILAGSADFTEMFTMDFGGNAILMSHMGEGNYKLAREDKKVDMIGSRLNLVDLRVRPVLLCFSLKVGVVTLVNLTYSPKRRLKMIVTEGRVVDFPQIKSITNPHYKFQPSKHLEDFLTELSREGVSHHFALAYGRWSSTLEKIARFADIEFKRI